MEQCNIAEGRTLARTYECKFIEVSAGIAHNVDELLVGILAQVGICILWHRSQKYWSEFTKESYLY